VIIYSAMSTNSTNKIRNKLYDYIRVADGKKLHAIYQLLENEIDDAGEWWKEKSFTKELDLRYEALESGSDKGFSKAQLEQSIEKLRQKRNAQ
jgi:DNA phosphorothioation-dependent restriction protein DptG